MANTHSKLKSNACKEPAQPLAERFYTIGYTLNLGRLNPRPQRTIKGKWLEQIKFYTGSLVIIKVEQGKLVVEIDLKL